MGGKSHSGDAKHKGEDNVEVDSRFYWAVGNRVKGKSIPLQAWTGPQGSRRLRLPDLKTIST
jgi:hypothetical protein